MKSRTILLPMLFAVTAVASTVPHSPAVFAARPSVDRQNPLLGELDTVVAGARDASVLLAEQVAVAPKKAKTCQNSALSSNKQMFVAPKSSPPMSLLRTAARLRTGPTPVPVKKTNPATHKP